MCKNLIAWLLVVLASIGNCQGHATVNQVNGDINGILSLYQELKPIVQSIKEDSVILLQIKEGPFMEVIKRLQAIEAFITSSRKGLDVVTILVPAGDAQLILATFGKLSGFNQQVMELLLQKARLPKLVPVIGQPVADALQSVGNALDLFGKRVAALVPTKTFEVHDVKDSILSGIRAAVAAYKGVDLCTIGFNVPTLHVVPLVGRKLYL